MYNTSINNWRDWRIVHIVSDEENVLVLASANPQKTAVKALCHFFRFRTNNIRFSDATFFAFKTIEKLIFLC